MFGKKKKEREAKLLAEQQSLLVPEDVFLEAEVIPDEDVEILNDEDPNDVVEETLEGDLFVEEATFSSSEANAEEEITFDDVDDFNAKADIDIETLNSQIQLDEVEKLAVANEAPIEEELLSEEIAEEKIPLDFEDAKQEEEVVYVVDGPEEDDEIVKPARLIKLPHLVDYLLNSDPKPTRQALMKYSLALAKLYNEIDEEEDKTIVKDCILKISNALR